MLSNSNLPPGGHPPRRFGQQSFRRLARESREVGLTFSDDHFRPQDKAVFTTAQYRNRMNIGRIQWLRPKELSYDQRRGGTTTMNTEAGKTVALLPPTRSDRGVLFVGNGPNPWVIAACVAVLEHRKLKGKLFRSDDNVLNTCGIMSIKIWQFGTWQKVVLDDKLPCNLDGVPIFAHPLATNQPNTFWGVPLLEKALAKIYGSYENLALKATLTSLLIDLTGGGTVESLQLDEMDKPEGEKFDIQHTITKEFNHKSLLLVKSKLTSSSSNLEDNRFYLLVDINKSATAGRTLTRSTEVSSVVLMSTQVENSSSTSSSRMTTVTLPDLKRKFDKMIIARPYSLNAKRIHRLCAKQSNAQFIFDVTTNETVFPVIITLQQASNCNYTTLGFRLYSIELNRNYRVHNVALNQLLATRDPADERNLTLRVCSLRYGRYLVAPICHQQVPLMLSIDSSEVKNLKELKQDMPRYQMFPFSSPRYPICVSRVCVRMVTGLSRQDRFGSANPYCIIRCNKDSVKSDVQHDRLEAKWQNLSALFYHRDTMSPIRIEVWHRSMIIVDNLIGQVEVMPKFRAKEDTDKTKEEDDHDQGCYKLELTNKSGVAKQIGTIHFELLTYEDLKYF